MVDTTWTNGGGDNKASTAANWSAGIDVGYNLIFDATSTADCTFDSDIELGTFTIGAGYSGVITQSSDIYIQGFSQAGGTFTGVTTKWVYCGGDLLKTAGTFSAHVTKWQFNNNANISTNLIIYFKEFFINECTVNLLTSEGTTTSGKLTITNNSTMNIATAQIFYSNAVFNDVVNGYFTGLGVWCWVNLNTGSPQIKNIIGCAVEITIDGGAASKLVTLNYDLKINNTFRLYSGHTVNTCTLNLNGHSLTATTITVGTRGILSNGAATPSVIRCASLDSSAGTFTPDRTVLVMEGASTVKLAAGGTVNSLISKGVTTLASDVAVSNVLVRINPITKGAFALTLTKPENEYTGLRRPIIIPVKNLDIGPSGLADGWMQDLGAVI